MTKEYIVEALLRPATEFYSSLVSFLAVIILILSPHYLMAPPPIHYAVIIGCCLLSVGRFIQGYKILRYRKNLKQVKRYKLRDDEIKSSPTHLQVGVGFLWEQLHTQRLHDIRTSEGLEYVKPSSIVQWVDRKRIEWQNKIALKFMLDIAGINIPFNPFIPKPQLGGLPFIHGLGVDQEQPVYLSLSNRKQHLIVEGGSGVGKTRVAETFIIQDIQRDNNCVIVIDPKCDPSLFLTCYQGAEKTNRPFYCFHLGFPQYSCAYNPLGSFSRITEISSRITSNLPGEGDAASFREFAWMFCHIVATSLIELNRTPTFKLIRRYIRNIDPLFIDYAENILKNNVENWDELIEKKEKRITDKYLHQSSFKDRQKRAVALFELVQSLDLDDPVLMGLTYAFRFERSYYDKITTSISPFLDKLLSPPIDKIISPDKDTKKKILEWNKAIRQKAVVYVALEALVDAEISSAIGASMLADLTSVAGRKIKHGSYQGLPTLDDQESEKEIDVIIHGDELPELLGRGKHMVTLLNKSRAAGFSINGYTQSSYDFIAETGSEDRAGQMWGNINTQIIMRVQDKKTAERFCDKLPDTFINSLMAVSGARDSASDAETMKFETNNEDRISKESVPMLTPADLLGLSIGQAFVLINGSELYKVRFPEPIITPNNNLPDYIKEMTDHMFSRYKSSDQWFNYESSIDFSVF